MATDIIIKIQDGDHYKNFVLKDPQLIALCEPIELPPEHPYRIEGGPTHSLLLAAASFRAAADPKILSIPDQLVGVHFVSGKGSGKVLGHKPSREYFWVDGTIYMRSTINEAGAGLKEDSTNRRSRRYGLAHKRNNRLTLYVVKSEVLNDPRWAEEVEVAVGTMVRSTMGM